MNLISHFFAAALLLILSWALPVQADVTVAMKAIERGHYATAQRALRKLATQGDARAQNNLAYLYEHGLGLERSYPDALSWYTRAADAGLPDAQYNLATFLHLGRGVSRDYPAAFQWYLKSAQAGFTDAQYMVGEYQREGYELFSALMDAIKEELASLVFNDEVTVEGDGCQISAGGVDE